MSDQEVIYDVKNYVATITINRPKTLNAFTGDTIKDMERLLAQAGNDPKVGVIVLTASGAGVTGGSSSYAYGSSKGGVHGLAMVLRANLASHGVRVHDVCPGNVVTPMKVSVIEQNLRVTGDQIAYEAEMAGLVRPEGIANVMAWLASDEAADVTGTIFTR